MKILVDTNVVMDELLDRQPHFAGSSTVWAASESRTAEGVLAAYTVTTIHYLIRRVHGAARAGQAVGAILRVFSVAPVDDGIVREASGLSSPDFEDAVTAVAALRAGCDIIVTRDPKGFRGSPVTVLAPEAAAPLLV